MKRLLNLSNGNKNAETNFQQFKEEIYYLKNE